MNVFPQFPVILYGQGMSREGAMAVAEMIRDMPQGLTLRQLYAGLAMPGIIAADLSEGDADVAAIEAWRYADAMLRYEQEPPLGNDSPCSQATSPPT